MNKEYLGELEELILTMVALLREEAYGAMIAQAIQERLQREANLSGIHVTLYRLEDKGFIKSAYGGSTNERGGRRKRIYAVTNAGYSILKTMQESRVGLWRLIPELKTF
jgi:PadR family transcriptional regulator PadR